VCWRLKETVAVACTAFRQSPLHAFFRQVITTNPEVVCLPVNQQVPARNAGRLIVAVVLVVAEHEAVGLMAEQGLGVESCVLPFAAPAGAV